MKQTFMNEPSDVEWLLSTHLKARPPQAQFRSFILYGNEDAPQRVDLYVSQDPNHYDPFVRVDLSEEVTCPTNT